MAVLRHPNIVAVTDTVEIDGRLALVLELVNGPDLGTLLKLQPLTLDQIDIIARGILEGMAHAHASGFVHRDLKPPNILLARRAGGLVPKISDFGLAKGLHTARGVTQQGMGMGTPPYTSPEQIADASSVGAAADVFSLGCMLFEMVTGQLPFDGHNVIDTFKRIESGDRQRVTTLRPTLPQRMVRAIEGALVTEASERIPTAQHLLDVWVDSTPPPAFDAPPMARETIPEVSVDRGEQTFTDVTIGTLWDSAAEDSTPAVPTGRRTAPPTPGHVVPAPHLTSAQSVGNLPPEVDRFIGRHEALAALRGLWIRGARVITLMGPGGMGKTRMSRAFGARFADRFPGGVWFCDLTEARTGDDLIHGVARALDITLAEQSPGEQVIHGLASRGTLLLILDNLEQLVEAAAPILDAWVRRAPQAVFLATSRIRLDLSAERVYALEPLNREEAVQLFVERVRQIRPDFALTAENRADLYAVVQQLDGLCLAIELAAARARLMSIRQIRDRLGHRFRLLQSTVRDRPARQQTLREAIAWSWNLLRPEEQYALAQCSHFRGGFTLEAAEAVVSLSPWDEWISDVIQRLIDQSLLRRVGSRESPRLQMFESVREFAREQLEAPSTLMGPGGERLTGPEAAEALHRRHAAHYAGLDGDDVVAAYVANIEHVAAHAAERDNVLCALASCHRLHLTDLVVPLTLTYTRCAENRDADPLVMAQLEQALAMDGVDPLGRILLQTVQQQLYTTQGRIKEALALGEGNLPFVETLDHPGLEAVQRYHLGVLLRIRDRAEAVAMLDEAQRCARRAGHTRLQMHIELHSAFAQEFNGKRSDHLDRAMALAKKLGATTSQFRAVLLRGIHRLNAGRLQDAESDLRWVVAQGRDAGDRRLICDALASLGTLYKDQGRLDDSIRAHDEAIALCQATGHRRQEAILYGNLGLVIQLQGDLDRARSVYEEALRLFVEMGDRCSQGCTEGNLGDLLLLQGHLDKSAERLLRAIAYSDPTYAGCFRGSLAWVRAQQGELDEARQLIADGERNLRGVWPYELARLLCRKAQVEQRIGTPEIARQALAEARRIAESVGALPASDLGQLIASAAALEDGQETLRIHRG